jgi:hypothetical protein
MRGVTSRLTRPTQVRDRAAAAPRLATPGVMDCLSTTTSATSVPILRHSRMCDLPVCARQQESKRRQPQTESPKSKTTVMVLPPPSVNSSEVAPIGLRGGIQRSSKSVITHSQHEDREDGVEQDKQQDKQLTCDSCTTCRPVDCRRPSPKHRKRLSARHLASLRELNTLT